MNFHQTWDTLGGYFCTDRGNKQPRMTVPGEGTRPKKKSIIFSNSFRFGVVLHGLGV